MKFLTFIIIFLLVFTYIPSAFAEVIDDEIDLQDTELSAGQDDTDLLPDSSEVPAAGSQSFDYFSDPETYLEDVQVLSLSPITSSDTSGLKAVMLDLIGPYDPVIVEYKYRNPNSNYDSYLREVQPDYVWMFSFGIFAMVVFCIFRMGGGLFGRR